MKYAALFKGINVGGKNIVKMSDLKQLLIDLGLAEVKTYIQSGNAIFETDFNEEDLYNMIYCGFTDRFGFESNVIIRNIDEIRALIEELPFSDEEIKSAETADPKLEHLYVCFLDNLPDKSKIDDIHKKYQGKDGLKMGKKELYLLFYQSIRESKLATITAKTFNSSTMRNWKTVNKLYDMMVSMQKSISRDSNA